MSDDIPATYCEMKKAAYRQTKDGLVISFLCHPNDMPDALAVAPLGTRYMLALVEIDDDEQPISRSDRGAATYRASDDMAKAMIRAAELPRDSLFRQWIAHTRPSWGDNDEVSEREAIDFIREQCCSGGSRAEIAQDQGAYERFLAMEQDYRMASGLAAEQR